MMIFHYQINEHQKRTSLPTYNFNQAFCSAVYYKDRQDKFTVLRQDHRIRMGRGENQVHEHRKFYLPFLSLYSQSHQLKYNLIFPYSLGHTHLSQHSKQNLHSFATARHSDSEVWFETFFFAVLKGCPSVQSSFLSQDKGINSFPYLYCQLILDTL